MSVASAPRGLVLGYLAAAVAVTIWAAWIIWLRVAVSEGYGAPLTPVDVGLFRFGAPALILAPVWIRGGLAASLKPKGVSWPVLIAMLAWGAPFVLLVSYGLKASSVAHMAALVPGVMPLFAAACAAILFRAPVAPSRRLGLALIAAAVVLVIGPSALAGATDALRGTPLLLLASALWACFAVAFPRSGLGPARAVGIVAAYSTAALLALAPFVGSRIPELSLGDLLWMTLLHGVLSGVVSIVTYNYAIEQLGAPRAASLSALVPVLAAAMGAAFLGETLSLSETAAILSASLGVALVNGAVRFGRRA